MSFADQIFPFERNNNIAAKMGICRFFAIFPNALEYGGGGGHDIHHSLTDQGKDQPPTQQLKHDGCS